MKEPGAAALTAAWIDANGNCAEPLPEASEPAMMSTKSSPLRPGVASQPSAPSRLESFVPGTQPMTRHALSAQSQLDTVSCSQGAQPPQ